MLRLYDVRTRQVEPVVAAGRRRLRVYSGGLAAGQRAQVGDLRSGLLPDLLRRVAERHRLWVEVCQPSSATTVLADAFAADCAALNIRPADHQPRGPESVGLAIELIGQLISGGHAYVAGDGSVYFEAQTSPDGPQRPDQPRGGQRPGPQPGLRSGADWALWTGVTDGRAPAWPSPWGPGFPAGSTAASAISRHYLGDVIDVRAADTDPRSSPGSGVSPDPGESPDAGEQDRERERAQSDAAAGHEVVRHWIQGGPVLLEGRELTGAAGPVAVLGDVTGRGLDPLALRLAFLRQHYREPLRLTWAGLADADAAVRAWRGQVADWATYPSRPMDATCVAALADALDDDLDAPAALAALAALAGRRDVPPGAKFETFADADRLLGLDLARDIGRAPEPRPGTGGSRQAPSPRGR